MLRPSAFILRRERVAVNRGERAGERAGRENTETFRGGSHGQRKLARFAVSPTNRAANSPRTRGRAGVSPRLLATVHDATFGDIIPPNSHPEKFWTMRLARIPSVYNHEKRPAGITTDFWVDLPAPIVQSVSARVDRRRITPV
jgi:hypothetical protein